VTKVVIPHWQGRVSPVFDVAGKVLVIETQGGVERSRQDVHLDAENPQARVSRLVEMGADVLVCGAISRPLELAVSAAGIDVIPQTCGPVDEVLIAFLDGRLSQGAFLMPGCGERSLTLGVKRRRAKQ
jgi:predicted Fe-Mo cluster-binding NifX family protein